MFLPGDHSLRVVYSFICNNKDWITEQLDISPLLPNNGQREKTVFNPRGEGPEEKAFNPLAEYNMIGDVKFDHVS